MTQLNAILSLVKGFDAKCLDAKCLELKEENI